MPVWLLASLAGVDWHFLMLSTDSTEVVVVIDCGGFLGARLKIAGQLVDIVQEIALRTYILPGAFGSAS